MFVTLLTIYALFGDDTRVIAFKKESDPNFDILGLICLTVFTIEISI